MPSTVARPVRRRPRALCLLGENLDRGSEARAEWLLDGHVQVAERLDLAGALEWPGVDRAQAAVGHDPADGLLRILGVRRDQDVERLSCHLALAERPGEGG